MSKSRPKIERGERVRRERVRIERDKHMPIFDTLFGAPPAEKCENPLDIIVQTMDLQTDADQEVSVMLQSILDERKRLRDEYRLVADSEYWVCLCFQSRTQKEEFLKEVGWLSKGDKYLNGLDCAESLGVHIEPIALPYRKGRGRIPKSLRTVEVLR